jgi:hypothetical protein
MGYDPGPAVGSLSAANAKGAPGDSTKPPPASTPGAADHGNVLAGGCEPNCTELQGQIDQALKYVSISPTGRKLLRFVQARPRPIRVIAIDTRLPRQSTHTAPDGVVFWDPFGAVEEYHTDPATGRPGRMSPAVALAHEFVHVLWPWTGDRLADTNGAVSKQWEKWIADELRVLGPNLESSRLNGDYLDGAGFAHVSGPTSIQ